jgi:hypothetical protein
MTYPTQIKQQPTIVKNKRESNNRFMIFATFLPAGIASDTNEQPA